MNPKVYRHYAARFALNLSRRLKPLIPSYYILLGQYDWYCSSLYVNKGDENISITYL